MSNSPASNEIIIHVQALSPLISFSPALTNGFDFGGTAGSWQVSSTPTTSTGTDYDDLNVRYAPGEGSNDEGWVMLSNISGTAFIPGIQADDWASVDVQAQLDSNPVQALSKANQTLSSSSGQANHTHTLKLQARGGLDFSGIDVQVAVVPDGSNAATVTLDDSSPVIQYQGFSLSSSSSRNDTALVPSDVVGKSLNGTLSLTATAGATASVEFTGTAIQLIGTVGPSLSIYTLRMDTQPPLQLNAQAPVFAAKQVLGFFTGLQQGQHHLVVTCGDGSDQDGGLAIDGLTAWGVDQACFGTRCSAAGTTTSSTSTLSSTSIPTTAPSAPASAEAGEAVSGPSAGSIVGGLLGGLLGLILLLLLFRKIRQRQTKATADKEAKKNRLNPWDQANMLETRSHGLPMVQVRPETEMPYYYPGGTAGTGTGQRRGP